MSPLNDAEYAALLDLVRRCQGGSLLPWQEASTRDFAAKHPEFARRLLGW